MKRVRREIRASKHVGKVTRKQVARAVESVKGRYAISKASPKTAPRLRRAG